MTRIAAACLAVALLGGGASAATPPPPEVPPQAKPAAPQPAPEDANKTARFRLQIGDIFLGLTCPDTEPLKACAEFAMQLLDKAQAIEKR